MFGLTNSTLLLLAMGTSAILYLILGFYKRYAYFWWAIGGIVICLPISMVIPKLKKSISTLDILPKIRENEILFIVLYLIIYTGLWIFTKRSEISEEERTKREKIDEAIFDGFLALKEKRIKDAYYIFKKGFLVDPDNPVIRAILASFQEGEHGLLVKKDKFFEWRYKLRLRLKGKKVKSAVSNVQIVDNDKVKLKKVKGKVIE